VDDAVAENADEDGNCDWKYHEQPDVVEHSDQLLMGHFYRDRLPLDIYTVLPAQGLKTPGS